MLNTSLLDDWRQKGIELRAKGDQLVLHAPRGAVTAEIAGLIRNHKAELLAFLSAAEAAASSAVRIERATRDHVPLSSGQQRLWYVDQLSGGSSAYNMPLALELAGRIDIDTLRRSIHHILKRHEALRTNLARGAAGEPCQSSRPKTCSSSCLWWSSARAMSRDFTSFWPTGRANPSS